MLLEDMSKRLKAGDPAGHDAAISLGAALEGANLAASVYGFSLIARSPQQHTIPGHLRVVGDYEFLSGANPDPLQDYVRERTSRRGAFLESTQADRASAENIGNESAHAFTSVSSINSLAKLIDEASYHFMRDRPFREELVSWMRLAKAHPNWSLDGLNADAMNLSRAEAFAVRGVLGPFFPALDKLNLAANLLSESAITESSSAIVVFHRDANEHPTESWRHFYRLWLEIVRAGFQASVLAALADHKPTAYQVAEMIGLPKDRRIVSAFRIGRAVAQHTQGLARLKVQDLIVARKQVLPMAAVDSSSMAAEVCFPPV